MAYQRVPETAEIVVHYTLYGAEVVNTYHAEYAGGYAQANLDALALNIDLTAVDGMLADQSVSLSYIRTDVRGLDAENDLSSTNSDSAGNGGVGTRSLPANCAFCVQKLSTLTGRSARGRVYVAGIPFNISYFDPDQANVLTTTLADAYKAHIDVFRQTINAVSGWQAVIVSRYHNGAKRSEGVTFEWTSTNYQDRKLDTRRGRMS